MSENGAFTGFFHPIMLTIVFIVLSAVIAAFIRGRKKDKCLNAFSDFMMTLKDLSGKYLWGTLRVESTGMELLSPEHHHDNDGHLESSYMINKYEYSSVFKTICDSIMKVSNVLPAHEKKTAVAEDF